AGQGDGDARAGGLDASGGSVVHQGAAEVPRHAGDASDGGSGLLRLPNLDGAIGTDEQQDQDDAAAGLWLPRQGVLQAENLRPPRGKVRITRMNQKNDGGTARRGFAGESRPRNQITARKPLILSGSGASNRNAGGVLRPCGQ